MGKDRDKKSLGERVGERIQELVDGFLETVEGLLSPPPEPVPIPVGGRRRGR